MQKKSVEAINSKENSSPRLIRHSDNLKPGSPVLVRVIKKQGNGRYEASVAGIRIMLHSEKEMKAGDTFKGIIGLKNGTITISPADSSDSSINSLFKVFSIDNGDTSSFFEPVTSPALASLLASLNLPPDNLSFQMLLQFKQLGINLDARLLQKIRRKAEKSENPQKIIETESIMAQKKLADIKPVSNLDSDSASDNEENNQFSQGHSQNKNFLETNETVTDWKSEIKTFLDSLSSGALKNLPGKLTLMNHMGFSPDKTSESTWITIPFEITNPLEDTCSGNGKFMILLGSSDKNFRQMNIHINLHDSQYRFILGTQGSSSQISKIQYAVQLNSTQNPDSFEKQKNNLFENLTKLCTNVTEIPFNLADGTGSSLESFEMVETKA